MNDPHLPSNDIFELIHEVLDAPSQDKMVLLQRHLDADPDAERMYRDLVALKNATRSLNRIGIDDREQVFRDCMKRIDEIDRIERTDAWVGRMRYALTAAVACLVIGVGYYNWTRANQATQDSLVPLRAAASGAVEASSVSSAIDWLRRTLGRNNVQPPPTAPTLRPIRAEVVRLPDCTVGRLILLDENGNPYIYAVSCKPFFQSGEPIGSKGFRCVRQGNLNILHWTDGQTYYALAGQCEPETLVELVE